MKQFFYRIFCGFTIGIALLGPGLSGSVMAIMMGIYEDILAIIANPFKNLKKNLKWIIPLGIGLAASFGMFAVVLSKLFSAFPLAAGLLFLGLVTGNLPAVFGDARLNGFRPVYAVPMALGFLLAFGFGAVRVILESTGSETIAPDALWYMAICGAVAGIISIVPGISIGTALLLFGVYDRLFENARGSVKEVMAIAGLGDGAQGFSASAAMAVTGACFVIGMVLFSRIIKTAITRYKAPAYWTIFAFVCGSLGAIALNLPINDTEFVLWHGIVALVLGVAIALGFIALSKRMRSSEV